MSFADGVCKYCNPCANIFLLHSYSDHLYGNNMFSVISECKYETLNLKRIINLHNPIVFAYFDEYYNLYGTVCEKLCVSTLAVFYQNVSK